MPLDEELDGFLGDETPLSRHTRYVAELLRRPGAPERWRDQCRQSFRERNQRCEQHKVWERERWQYASKNFSEDGSSAAVRPGEGWSWHPRVERPVLPRQRKLKATGAGWLPPEFDSSHEPFNGSLLPFSSGHTPSLADCYLVLAVVHDAERRGPGKIRPFPVDDIAAGCFFHAHMCNVEKLNESDQLALDDCLVRVEANLIALEGSRPSGNIEATAVAPSAARQPAELPWGGPDWDELAPIPRRLLRHMHERESDQIANFTDIVWEKDNVSEGAIHTAISRANSFLRKHGYPKFLIKVRGEKIIRWQ